MTKENPIFGLKKLMEENKVNILPTSWVVKDNKFS